MEDQPESSIIHREFDTASDDPALAVAETVAELEGVAVTDLPTMWECIDGMLDHLFSRPPAAEAQMEVVFSYSDYRITVEQEGNATFVKTD